MGEPGKWALNPQACLRELGRMDNEPGYRNTICGVHRILWSKLNVDLSGYLPEEALEELNALLEEAFRMGKRMDYRLNEYYQQVNGATKGDAIAKSLRGDFVAEVECPPTKLELAHDKRRGKGDGR